MTIKVNFSCTYTFFFVPLQRKAEQSVCRHIIKAFISACFGNLKTGNFHPIRNKKAVNALWDMYIPPQSIPCGLLCLVAFHIRRGRSLLILIGKVFQCLRLENKQR